MASMRVLVTGVTGFAGGWLAEALLAKGGVQLFGLSRRPRWPAVWQHLTPHVALFGCDLTDRDALEHLLRQIEPEQIYHLAGYPHVGRSFQEPEAAWASNLGATLGLYDIVARLEKRPRILAVSSGLIYGDPQGDRAFDEESPLRPTNPYSASK